MSDFAQRALGNCAYPRSRPVRYGRFPLYGSRGRPSATEIDIGLSRFKDDDLDSLAACSGRPTRVRLPLHGTPPPVAVPTLSKLMQAVFR